MSNMEKVSLKRYECTRCGFVTTQSTNHYGPTWSWGRVNTCPNCPPYAKYPEFGGSTNWRCLDNPDQHPDPVLHARGLDHLLDDIAELDSNGTA